MKNSDSWIKSGFFVVFQNLLTVLFSFGSFYLLIRLLGKHDFGAWTLFVSTVTILELGRNGLVQNGLVKFLSSEDKTEHPKIISASLTISAALTFACILAILILAGYFSGIWNTPELRPIFNLYCITFIISGLLSQFNCILQAHSKFRYIFISSAAVQPIFFGYILICYLKNYQVGLINLAYVQMFSISLSCLISYFFAREHFTTAFKTCREWISSLFNYGKYAFGTSVSAILSVTIDQMMLGAMLSPVSSGAFNVAIRLTNILDIPTNAVAVTVFPQSAKRLITEGKQGVKYLYEKSVGILIALLIPGIAILYIFSDFVVHIIAGERYAETIPLLQVTLMYCLFTSFNRQSGSILDSIGQTRLNFLVVVFITSINIGLNYILINRIGVMGAAYATLISHIIAFVISQTILKRQLNVSTKNAFIYAFEFYPELFRKYIRSPKATDLKQGEPPLTRL